jgi:dihydroflavonol-4-reductase
MTGANGFVGLNIVAALRAAGHEVTAFVRPESNVKYLQSFDVRLVHGELGNLERLTEAMKSAEAVIHTAGNTSCFARDLPKLEEVNVRGTRNVVTAAIANGVRRIVFTSTTSTIGAVNGDEPASESTPLTGFRARSPYAITKTVAEKIVLAAQARGVECVILNPGEVVGAFDHTMQWGRIVLAVHYNKVPFLPPGGGSFCSAADVGRAHVSALTRGTSGERYILGGVNARFSHFLEVTSRVLGRRFDVPRMHYSLLYARAFLQEKLAPLMRSRPPVEPYRMRVFGGTYYFDSSKAANALAYASAPLEQMVRDCSDWYRDHQFIH